MRLISSLVLLLTNLPPTPHLYFSEKEPLIICPQRHDRAG